MNFKYLSTNEMVADGMMKPLKMIKHAEFIKILRLKQKKKVEAKIID